MSAIVKHAVVINGRKTNVSLEQEFWSAPRDIASWHSLDLQGLVSAIDAARDNGNLSSQLRLAVLAYFKSRTPIGRSDQPTPNDK